MSTFDPINPAMDPLGNPLGPGPDPADVDPPIPDDLVDAFFDRELDETTRAAFTRRLDEDASCCERVAKTNRMLSMLRRGVRPPDLSASILDRVDQVRGFVPRRHRRLIRAGRIAVVMSMLGVVATAVLIQRSAPEVVAFGTMPSPVRDVASAACEDAAGFERLARSVRGVRGSEVDSLRLVARIEAGGGSGVRWSDARTGWRSLDRSPCEVVYTLADGVGGVGGDGEVEGTVSVRVVKQRSASDRRGDELVLMVGGRIVRVPLAEIGLEASSSWSIGFGGGSGDNVGGSVGGERGSAASLVPVTFTRRAPVSGVRASSITDLP